jgi:3'-phosphoadenosine 5'-phosphosulfate sulfotransferase (PAPS reductase)/FAD synthetase
LSGIKNLTFSPLKVVSDEWEQEFIKREKIELCKLYQPPYNFKRTGCKGCPFNKDIQKELETLKKILPNEYKQCLHLWKPVYDEYVRIGYRLDRKFYDKCIQYTIDDFIEEVEV